MTHSKVTALANTTHEIEVKDYDENGKVTNFTVATHHEYKSGSEYKKTTCYSDWTAFGRFAERLGAVPVGSLLYLEGRLENDKFKDKFNQKRLKVKFIVQTLKVIRKPEKSKPEETAEKSEATQ